jgi:hypothetical protein
MRQRSLNSVLAGALAALFCLLAATAYTEVKHDDAGPSCAFENHTLKPRPARCEICVASPCDSGAMTVKSCAKGRTCIIGGRLVDRDPKSTRLESRLWAGIQMQP